MNLKREFSARSALVYLVALPLVYVLTEVLWGATGGLLGGLVIARDPEYQQKVASFLEERGIDERADAKAAKSAYGSLSQEDKKELERMTLAIMARVNWFYVTLFVSAAVFALVGFLGGFAARGWILAGTVPALSFLVHNPLRFRMARDLPTGQTVIVIALAQFAVCFALAYCGARLGLRRDARKDARTKGRANPSSQRPVSGGDDSGEAETR
ncbi:MAG: hypothetical protein ACYTFI_05175 [Planctomycetota bacterium]|jgi:hypothetical protein